MRLFITPPADHDLDDQFDYLAGENVDAAVRFFHAAHQTFNALLTMPHIGRLRFPLHPELRDVRLWFVQGFEKHLILYRVLPDTIEIVRVLHSARDIENVLTDEGEGYSF